ncbi:Heat shock factor 2-binding protein [Liparis tanakae]|uniref:Heat shock factor 2-binding protein n=1 Tax=Liparis tanakae TaxID=230148 RepID=A0A4Z2FP76_9TELE|nr:Heat shock factor 2-binding protein [Liparis tanakae]
MPMVLVDYKYMTCVDYNAHGSRGLQVLLRGTGSMLHPGALTRSRGADLSAVGRPVQGAPAVARVLRRQVFRVRELLDQSDQRADVSLPTRAVHREPAGEQLLVQSAALRHQGGGSHPVPVPRSWTQTVQTKEISFSPRGDHKTRTGRRGTGVSPSTSRLFFFQALGLRTGSERDPWTDPSPGGTLKLLPSCVRNKPLSLRLQEQRGRKRTTIKMAASLGGKLPALSHDSKRKARKQGGFVRVRKSDLEKLTTEVMQLRDFLPRVLNGDLIHMLHTARAAHTASQTLESFVMSLDEELKTQTEDYNSHEHQFVLAVAGTITNVAAVACGRDFLSISAHALLDTLMRLLELMTPGVFPKLKVLMLMTLYNVSISVKGLKCISENPGLLALIRTLLDDADWEVCLHSLRLLQSVLLEEEVLLLLGSSLLDPDLQAQIVRLTSSGQPGLRRAAQQSLEDLLGLQQLPQVNSTGPLSSSHLQPCVCHGPHDS